MVCFYRYAASSNRSNEATLSLVCYSRTGQRFFSKINESISQGGPASASQVGPLSCILVLPERVSELCLGSQRDLLPAPVHCPICAGGLYSLQQVCWGQVLTLINLFLVLQMSLCMISGDAVR